MFYSKISVLHRRKGSFDKIICYCPLYFYGGVLMCYGQYNQTWPPLQILTKFKNKRPDSFTYFPIEELFVVTTEYENRDD